MALGTAALTGAGGPGLRTRAPRRSQPVAVNLPPRRCSLWCRAHQQGGSSHLALAPAPPQLPLATCEAVRGVRQHLNNLVPFPQNIKASSRGAAGSLVEQRHVSMATAEAGASGALQQRAEAAAQPVAASSFGSIPGAAVRARRRSRLLARAAPGAAAAAEAQGQQATAVPAAAVPALRRRPRASARLTAAQEQELAEHVAAGDLLHASPVVEPLLTCLPPCTCPGGKHIL